MSNNVNTELLEEVADFIDNLRQADTYFEYQADYAIKHNDLEELRYLLKVCCDICGDEQGPNCNNANCDFMG